MVGLLYKEGEEFRMGDLPHFTFCNSLMSVFFIT